ncbi:DUF58 domain-containing protein [Azohydromonas caseinilytica]|uniref:DUF58 domain-containing protein n=1 Tax=Azohydromonas caseinilytica TaxID=2728836 RepID=A0A848F4J4_9BURK|nr:DUF58 domain-containing protein [Azohydromonas caseinilytica]NML14987.1 DUF58 domain-containing protein [Azohydromonas caseinilytica]
MADRPAATPPRAAGAPGTLGLPGENAEALLRRLEWSTIRRLDGWLQGDYRTLFRGEGLDLADLREYQHHDDVRRIDWNVTARLQEPYVREYTEDRDIAAWFLLDLSPSVHFGSRRRSKAQVGIEFTAVIARLLARRGNRVGALLYGSRVDTVMPARGGKLQVLELLQRLMNRPAPTAMPQGTRLSELLRTAQQQLRRRSLVFVLSDFFSQPGWSEPLAMLALRHEVIAVRLYDPLEMELPDLGMVYIQDAETGEQLMVDTHSAAFRKRFAGAARRREAELRDGLAQAGVDTLELASDEDLATSIVRFVHLRRQRSRLTAGSVAPRAHY